MNKITREEYQEGITKLVRLAYMRISSSRVAAQVLLSAYNGDEFQLDIVDLALLDSEHYLSAINVIRGRIEINSEPQHFIEEGDRHFHALWDRWNRYHISNRWKRECYDCAGSGKVYENQAGVSTRVECCRCRGSGLVGEEW